MSERRNESSAAQGREYGHFERVDDTHTRWVPGAKREQLLETALRRVVDKKMPLDADPVADHTQAGLFVLRETERRDGPLAIAAWGLNGLEPHYRCHFDTCSDRGRSSSSQVSSLAGSTWEDVFGARNG